MPPFALSGHNIDPRLTPISRRSGGGTEGLLRLTDHTVTHAIQPTFIVGTNFGDGACGDNVSGAINDEYLIGWQVPIGIPADAQCELKWQLISGGLEYTPGILLPGDLPEDLWSYDPTYLATIYDFGSSFNFFGKTSLGTAVIRLFIRGIPGLGFPPIPPEDEVSALITLINT